jgi:hypothetical protein
MYSRRACGLCDAARTAIHAERERRPFAFDEVFIDGDDELERAFGLRVPVVAVDGEEHFEFEVDVGRLRTLLDGPA